MPQFGHQYSLRRSAVQHNQWSDGQPLAEWAIDWYKSHGYHFVCPSDHNIFQSDDLRFDGFGFNNEPADRSAFKGETSLWKVVSQRYVNETIEKFGADSVRRLTVGDKTYLRMTPSGSPIQPLRGNEPGYEGTNQVVTGTPVSMEPVSRSMEPIDSAPRLRTGQRSNDKPAPQRSALFETVSKPYKRPKPETVAKGLIQSRPVFIPRTALSWWFLSTVAVTQPFHTRQLYRHRTLR